MLDHFYADSKLLHRKRSGPLGTRLDGLADLLLRQGYTRPTGRDKLRVVLQLNDWLEARQFPLQGLNERRLGEFRAERRKRRRSPHGEAATLALLLDSLRQAHAIPAAVQASASNSLDLIVEDYGEKDLQRRAFRQHCSGIGESAQSVDSSTCPLQRFRQIKPGKLDGHHTSVPVFLWSASFTGALCLHCRFPRARGRRRWISCCIARRQ